MKNQYKISIPEYQLKSIKQQEEAMNRMLKNLDIDKLMQGIDTEVIKKAQDQANEFSRIINSSYNTNIQEAMKIVSQIDIPQIPEYIKNLAESIARQSKIFQNDFAQTHPKVKESIMAMINIGWYPDIENFAMSALINFKDQLSQDNISEVDNALVKYYKENLPRIMEYMLSKYPHREEILNAAFEAHAQGNYLLSIPVLLVQIDGIAVDTFRNCFFIKQRGSGNPKISQVIDGMNGLNDLSLALLTPLQSAQPLIYSEKERDGKSPQLNRHQVLHGESLDYGTETNSYKVISLLLYISQAADIVNLDNNGEN